MICPYCNSTIEDNVTECPYCKQKLNNELHTKYEDILIANNNGNPETLEKVINQEEEIVNPQIINNVQEENNIKNDNEVLQNWEYQERTTNSEQEIQEEPSELTNPTAPEETKASDKINLFILIKLMIGAIVRPGNTIQEYTRGFTKTNKGFRIYAFFSLFTLIGYIIANIINGCFLKIYDVNTGTYTTMLDFGNLTTIKYTRILLIGLLLCYGVGILITTAYYLLSFITNKGLSYGRYLSLISLCMLPYDICVCVLSPILSIPSYELSVAVSLFGITYSLIIIVTIINDVIKFKNTNQKIQYNTIAIGISLMTIGIVITIFLKDVINLLNLN